VYVSYDGALDPLGSSQVVPYLEGMRGSVRFVLVSFEKPVRWSDRARRTEMTSRLAAAGIEWRPLPYHSRPRVPATGWDVLRGALTVGEVVRRTGAALVHCRGEVAADRRGFFADERVESGSWRAGSLLDRLVRRAETSNLDAADGLVVLTDLARSAIGGTRAVLPPTRVIPTCVDTTLFRPGPGEERPYSAVYSGSLGTWYMVDEMVSLARELTASVPGRVLFLTPDVARAHRAGVTADWAEARECAPSDVPLWLRRARASFFVIRPTPAKRASCPTKLGEALATGLPVVANRGIGDVDSLLEREGVGVLLAGLDATAYRSAASRLALLLADAQTSRRCRSVAERHFGLDVGVARYRDLYRELGVVA
jgi:hypothetical protein